MVKVKKDKKDNKNNIKTILAKNMFGITVFLLLIFILSGYLQKDTEENKNITLTELVNDINSEKIASIENINEKINLVYKDGTEKTSKKEGQSSLTETLSNLGVDKTKLALTSIEIKDDKSAGYIAVSILPFLFPIILFFLIIWFLSRGMKGEVDKLSLLGQLVQNLCLLMDRKRR